MPPHPPPAHRTGALPARLLQTLLDSIATAIFSVLATLGVVPIIRCPRGGAAQMVADRLARRLRDALRSGAPSFADGSGSSAAFQRPVLVLAERSADMAVVLQHPWSYRALCHDLLGMRLNRLQCADSAAADDIAGAAGAPNGGKRITHAYNLEPSDFFWRAQAASPFPAVAEAVDAAIQAYRVQVEAINAGNANGAAGGAAGRAACASGGGGSCDDLGESTRQLQAAMSALPELQERKRVIDMHTNIATALLHKIKMTGLDSFVSAEEAVLARSLSAADRATLEELVTTGAAGTAEDRVRLLRCGRAARGGGWAAGARRMAAGGRRAPGAMRCDAFSACGDGAGWRGALA